MTDRLIDGSLPKSSDALLDELASLGIETETTEHAPMFTVEDSKTLRVSPGGQGDIKNLFLRNKKGQMWLVSCHEDRKINLKMLAKSLGAGRFLFLQLQCMDPVARVVVSGKSSDWVLNRI